VTLSLDDWHHRYLIQAKWTEDIRRYLFDKANLQPNDTILEVGSGTGAILETLSREYKSQYYGIDIEGVRLRYAKNHDPSFFLSQADGYFLPFRDHIFSITYCHYLLLWLENPVQILIEMARVTHSGGHIIALAEPDHASRLDYPPPLDHLGEMQTASLQAQGVDTQLGRKLANNFQEAGLREVEYGILGAHWLADDLHDFDTSEWEIIHKDLNQSLSKDQLVELKEMDIEARQAGLRVLFVPTFYARGLVA
jgi:ubiquinone/menaquinone biosynthesis C-methylase UbiE